MGIGPTIKIKNFSLWIFDFISFQGMIYLHESPFRYHGALHTGNCLVDARWVVKLADFGLREFKKGAEDPCLKDPNKLREKCYSTYINIIIIVVYSKKI